jgi:carboxypeptidase C (cathepsin A)
MPAQLTQHESTRRIRPVAFLLGLLSAGLVSASPSTNPDDEPVIQTQHEVRIGGKNLAYQAETGRVAIRDVETGEAHGQMFYITYRLAGDDKKRPVTFVWNGGPGANSALLHFEIAGPKRLEGAALVDNADTWLTETDLVFVDPIGTGFSRPTKPEYAEEFYGTLGDVASVTEFVRAWLILHAAEDRPVILAGESWGAGRAGQVGYRLLQRGVQVRGLVLISGGTGIGQDANAPGGSRELRQALQVVDRTATARFHQRLGRNQDVPAAELKQQAESWARQVYAPALQRIGELSAAEKEAIVTQLSGFTGMPAGLIDRETLVINPRPYREGLLAETGPETGSDLISVLDVFDMRLLRDADPAASGEGRAQQQTLLDHLRGDLGYRSVLPYLGTEGFEQGYAPRDQYPQPVGYRWDYATAEVTPEEREAAYQAAVKHGGGPPQLGPPLPSAAEAVALYPQLRVLVAAGLYDSLNSCAGNEELASQLQEPLASAYAFRCYPGGHMMYRDMEARVALSEDLRKMARNARP